MEFDEKSRIDLKLLYNLSNLGHLDIIKWCMVMRLMTKNFKCPKCGRDMKFLARKDITDGYVWSCRVYGENAHHTKRTVRYNSWFNDSRLSILTILLITYLWIKKTSHEFIADELGVTQHTVSEWFNYCQQICVEICVLESELLGGEGITVEIHEMKFTQGKNPKFKGVSGKWLIIGMEKGTNKYFFSVNKNKNKEALLSVIENWVLPGSVIISDFWNTYNCFTDKHFKQLKISHNLTFQHPDKTRIASDENILSIVKNLIRGSSCPNDVFTLHLAEYLWRHAHNENARSLIESFFKNLTKIFPPLDDDY